MTDRFPAIHHVGIVVRDIESTVEAYKRRGISGDLNIFDITFPEARYRGQRLSFSARYGFIDVGETKIELCQPLDETSPYFDMLQETGEGIHHLCYMVPSVKDHLEEIRKESPDSEIILEASVEEPLAEFAYVRIEAGVLLELLWMG
jgi:methylmalonyl-CoA/ethylmalonyl-CoA epimerase